MICNEGYECEKCGKKFINIVHLQEHIKSDLACEKYMKKTIECEDCGKKFTLEKNKKSHQERSCINSKIPKKKTIKQILIEQQEEIKNLKKTLEKTKRKPGRPKKNMGTNINNSTIDTLNNTNNNISTQNNIGKQEINQNFFIVEYGNEDISELTLDEKKSILHSKYDAIRKCAEVMHCNPNHPELRNIAITNLRANTGLIFKNGKFRIRTKDGMLEDLIRDKANNVQDILDEGGIIISKATRDKLTHLLELVNENDTEQMKNLKQDLEFLLYEENKTIH